MYLSNVVTSDGYYEKDIRSRIAMRKKAFMDKRNSSTLKLDLWKRLIKRFVWSVALYAAETTADKKQLVAVRSLNLEKKVANK